MREPFKADLKAMRARARQHIEKGAVTDAYGADRERVLEVLNAALATEIVCVLRYRNHHFMARGINSGPVAAEFLEHATEEQRHADVIAERIVQLGGVPDFNPATLTARSHAEYQVANSLRDMIREDLVAERIAIETYTEIVRWLGEGDPTTRRLIEGLLAKEEEHAEDLADLLAGIAM